MTLMLVYRSIWICCYYEAFIYGLVKSSRVFFLDDVCDHERCGGWAAPLGSVFMLLSEQWTRLQSRKSGQI